MITINDINNMTNMIGTPDHPDTQAIRIKLRASFPQDITDEQIDQAILQAPRLTASTELGQLPSVPLDPCNICKTAAKALYDESIDSIKDLFVLLRLAITAVLELAYWWALQRCGNCPDPL